VIEWRVGFGGGERGKDEMLMGVIGEGWVGIRLERRDV
jgi:hypothetical protein